MSADPEADAPSFRWPTVGETCLALAVFVCAMMVGSVFAYFRDALPLGVWLALAAVSGELTGLVLALAVARWPWHRVWRHCAVPRGTLRAVPALAFGCLAVTASLLWAGFGAGGPPKASGLVRAVRDASEPVDVVLMFLLVAVQSPVVEEILVRGVLLRGFTLNWGPVAGIATSTAVFALLHFDRDTAVLASVVGIVFALTVLRTGSLAPALLTHALINGQALVAAVTMEAPSTEPVPASGLMTAIVAAVGVGAIAWGLRRLPKDPARLATFWGLPASTGTSLAAIRKAALALRPVTMVPPPLSPPLPQSERSDAEVTPCPACGERVRSGLARCWFCGRTFAPAAED